MSTLELRYLDLTPKWKRYGHPDIGSPPPPPPPPPGLVDPRESLVYGSYIPGLTPNTTGHRNVDPLTGEDVVWIHEFGNSTTKAFTPVPNTPTTPYKNTIFWCKVAHSNTLGGSKKVYYDNCQFPGRRPEDITAAGDTLGGCIQNFGADPAHLYIKNCTFNPKLWFDRPTGDPLKSATWSHPLQVGIHGGNFDMVQTEMVNCQDAINYSGPTTDGPAGAASCLFEANWVHKNFYLHPWTTLGAPTSQDTHSDAFQFNTGRNIVIRNNMLGGIRDLVGYNATVGYNSGDDPHNACIMAAQEAGTTYAQHVGPAYVGYNWMGGGAASINIFYKNGNDGSDWVFEKNKIMLRGTTGQPAGNGFYIYRSIPMISTVQLLGNVIWDPSGSINGTGVAAPIVNY